MSVPIRSSDEISLIINKGNNAVADIGYDIVGDAKRGAQFSDPDFKDKIYRLILLRTYLKNLVQQDGTLTAYYQSSANEKKLNTLLDAVNQLSRGFAGSGVPLIRGKRIPLMLSALGSLPIGGTAGQFLKKVSSADYDSAWNSLTTSDIIDLSTTLANYLLKSGGIMSGAIAMGSNKITGLGAGTTNGDALRYEQVIGVYQLLGQCLLLAGGTMSGSIAMGSNKITGLAAGTSNGDALRYEQLVGVYQLLGQCLLLSGGTMSGAIAMGGNKITGLGAGSANGDAIRYEQVINQYLLLAGGTMAGDIAMGSHKITGLAAASNNGEAVRYEQLAGLATVAQGSWTAITFTHGWSGTAYYRTNVLGMTSLRGSASAAAATNVIMTANSAVPVPIANGRFLVSTGQDPSVLPAARGLIVFTDGSLEIDNYNAGDNIDLSGIHYWTV